MTQRVIKRTARPRKRRQMIKYMRQTAPSTSTGSPDSVTIAEYIKDFEYRPSRKNEILKKYQSIIEHR